MVTGFSSYMANVPAGSLWLLKVNGGVDCIGEYVPQLEPHTPSPFLRFRKLRVIVYEPVPPNSVRISNFMHFLLPAGDVEIDLHDKDIVTIVPCPEPVAGLYRTAVSGIQVGGKDVERLKRKLS